MFLLDEQANELVAKVFDGDIRNGKEVQQVILSFVVRAAHIHTPCP